MSGFLRGQVISTPPLWCVVGGRLAAGIDPTGRAAFNLMGLSISSADR